MRKEGPGRKRETNVGGEAVNERGDKRSRL